MYIWCLRDDFMIITMWVDNLLPFAIIIRLMNKMKPNIKAKWEVTDLGELSKIVSIEITIGKDLIAISQSKYIESILRRRDWSKQIQS